MSDVPTQTLKNILTAIAEDERLKMLTNEELVREYLKLGSDEDGDLHTDEMLTRLWPKWTEIEL